MKPEVLNLLEPATLVPPGKETQEVLDQTKRRYVALSTLKNIDGKCCWCNSKKVEPPLRRYCSSECSYSASFRAQPQNPKVKIWLLIHRQGFACRFCGLLFEEEIEQRIQRKYFYNKDHGWLENGKVSYFSVGYGTGHLWEVDHIVPIHKGGRPLDLDNLQVICTSCHKKKTLLDRG